MSKTNNNLHPSNLHPKGWISTFLSKWYIIIDIFFIHI
jgi:hypothetical protein